MQTGKLILAALLAAVLTTPVMADDPADPAMRTAAARARDRAIIRELNRQQLAAVRERDSGYAAGWQAFRERGSRVDDDAAHRRDRADAESSYAQSRAQYQQDLADWRRAVAACRAGYYDACEK